MNDERILLGLILAILLLAISLLVDLRRKHDDLADDEEFDHFLDQQSAIAENVESLFVASETTNKKLDAINKKLG